MIHIYQLQFLWVRNPDTVQRGPLALPLTRLQSSLSVGRIHSLAHMDFGRIQFLVGCSIEASVSPELLMNVFPWFLATWASAWSFSKHGSILHQGEQVRGQERALVRQVMIFCSLITEETASLEENYQVLHTQGEEIKQRCEYREVGIIGSPAEVAYYRVLSFH